MNTLSPSGISEYQHEIMYPDRVFKMLRGRDDFEMTDNDADMWLYSSQIHLCIILNGAHDTLYNSDMDTPTIEEVAKKLRVHADILMSWRKMLPSLLAWDDSDPPATDINIARLRAKFYGAHYVILRPLLHRAVHDFPSTPTNMQSAKEISALSTYQHSILTVAAQCVSSAIQSTIAFDRVVAGLSNNSRFTVTNIFGTLHA
jgi:hypothetical protein